MFRILAYLVVLMHLLFIVFVLFGALLALKWPKIIWIHIPAAIWGALVEFLDRICPLTPMENYFRRLSDSEMYSGDFITQYINPVLYPDFLTRNLQWILGSVVIIVNVLIYFLVFRKLKKKGRTENVSRSRY